MAWLQLREMRSRLNAVEVSRDELGVKLSRSDAALKQLQHQSAQLSMQKQVPQELLDVIKVQEVRAKTISFVKWAFWRWSA